MHLEALPMQFVALTDGVLHGEEHVLLFLQQSDQSPPRGFALNLADSRALLFALSNLLPEAQRIQNGIREQN